MDKAAIPPTVGGWSPWFSAAWLRAATVDSIGLVAPWWPWGAHRDRMGHSPQGPWLLSLPGLELGKDAGGAESSYLWLWAWVAALLMALGAAVSLFPGFHWRLSRPEGSRVSVSGWVVVTR